MKIAVLSDIHGNHYALSNVLAEAKQNYVDLLLILGDIVGYYYYPDKVLALIREWPFHMIKGNHEEILSSLIRDPRSISDIEAKYGNGHKIAKQRLTCKDISFLENLPHSKEVTFDNVSILMTHGSPWDRNLYIYPDTATEVLEKFNQFDYDFILFGHTHYTSYFRTRNGFAINPGSVGQSRENGGIACWSIMNTQNKTVQPKTTRYDTSQLKRDVMQNDPFNEYNLKILDR